ncbi:MAG TPA: ATP-binding cassette domain-containing protein [Candidatus Limiplasma sp.]|nr:ATP-binding cassette domain-containing protein [Candidatus Limiplasma sp.]HRX08042.1 ATP-binding cassette domain-containing protein [Candidatus Limiplasma sp.]
MADKTLLELKSVSKHFQVKSGVLKAVNDVSLTIYKGETLGLVGESGCGKTTLGRTLVKLYQNDEGSILYKGKDIWSYNRRENLAYHKNVQIIYQDPYASLNPLHVVRQSISEGLEIHHLYKGKKRNDRVLELLDMVGLNQEHANRFPHEFSGGQRQRIGIARALAVEPELIICDEPVSALDVSIQAQIVNLIMRLQKEMGLSYLFITHDLSLVKQISDRIAVMYLGSIVELAPAQSLYEHHYHPYTSALLSAIPIPDPVVEKHRRRILLSGDVPNPINLDGGCSFRSRCPKATERCAAERPQLREITPAHFVACHHAD